MQRLREQTSSPDPATARAAALLSAMPPLDAGALRRRPLPAEGARRGGAGRLRTALVLAMTLGSVAAAAATLRETGWLAGGRRTVAQAPGVTAAASPGSPRPGARALNPRDDQPPAGAAPVDPAPVNPPTSERAAQPGGRHLGGAATTVRSTAPVASTGAAPPRSAPKAAPRGLPASAPDGESALIVGAVRALRRDHDPARAQALAEEALQSYPHGVQVEEAMALAMEAASTNHDVAGARRAAQRYLARFPAGRFTDRAERILALPPG